MSQDDAVAASRLVLEELHSWPEETCRRELPSVLPQLLISLEGAEGRVASSRPLPEAGGLRLGLPPGGVEVEA